MRIRLLGILLKYCMRILKKPHNGFGAAWNACKRLRHVYVSDACLRSRFSAFISLHAREATVRFKRPLACESAGIVTLEDQHQDVRFNPSGSSRTGMRTCELPSLVHIPRKESAKASCCCAAGSFAMSRAWPVVILSARNASAAG